MKRLLLIAFCLTTIQGFAQDNEGYQRPPEEIAKLVEAPLTPAINISPDKNLMALLDRSDYPSIEELSRPELRIAGLRINPENFGPSRSNYFIGLKFKNLKDKKDYEASGLPSPLKMSSFTFSPDSKKVSFLQTYSDRIELWMVDLTTFKAHQLTKKKINVTTANPVTWLSNSNQLVFLAVPDGPKMPQKTRVPSTPVIEENLGKKAPSRTYQDLLKSPYDEALFDYYCTSQLHSVSLDGAERPIGNSAVYTFQNPSPDGSLLMVKAVHHPYSYLVPVNLFPLSVQVIDLNGKIVKNIAEIPLADNIPVGFSATIKGPRAHAWRADQLATVYWAEAQDGGDPKVKTDV